MVVVVLCTYIIDSKIFETTIPGRPPPTPNSKSGDRMGDRLRRRRRLLLGFFFVLTMHTARGRRDRGSIIPWFIAGYNCSDNIML